ncbi:MAG: DUF561 domain-containing protein [Cyanobacteria bacterium P01_H01_bin.15]
MNSRLQQAFAQSSAVKIISGLNNFDVTSVLKVVRAAEAGGATYVDIAATPTLVRAVRQAIDLPICVSGVDPQPLVDAVNAGADLVEIGNFDTFYAHGRRFEAPEVLALTIATRKALPSTTLSVTVPHILPLDEQVELAQALVVAGANLIQTEGGTSTQPTQPGILGLMTKAVPTLAAAHAISRAIDVPVLCASGLSSATIPLAIATGASGVGVGSAVNRLDNELAMVAAVRALVEALPSGMTVRT